METVDDGTKNSVLNDSINITGHTSDINAIANIGKDPNQWLATLKELENLNGGLRKQKLLQHFFAQARKILQPSELRTNRSYASLLGKKALFYGETNASEARSYFQEALATCYKSPILYVMFAQFELDQGRKEKASKILKHGATCQDEYGEIDEARKRLEQGFTMICRAWTTKDRCPLKNVTNSIIARVQDESLYASKDINRIPHHEDHAATAISHSLAKSQLSEREPKGLKSTMPYAGGNSESYHTPTQSKPSAVSWKLDIKSPVPPPDLDVLSSSVASLPSSNLTFHSGMNYAKRKTPKSAECLNRTVLPCTVPSSQTKKNMSASPTSKIPHTSSNICGGPRRVLVNREKSERDSDSEDDIHPISISSNASAKYSKSPSTKNNAATALPLPSKSSSAFKPYSKNDQPNSNLNLASLESQKPKVLPKQHHLSHEDSVSKQPLILALPASGKENNAPCVQPGGNLGFSLNMPSQTEPGSQSCNPSESGITPYGAGLGCSKIVQQIKPANFIPPSDRYPQNCKPSDSSAAVYPGLPCMPGKKVIEVNGVTYVVLKLLGKGGSSKVYQVLNPATSEIVAVKQVNILGCESSVLEGYKNEISFLGKLQGSRHIIRLIDHDIRERHLYLVMECGSLDLSAYLKKQKALGVPLDLVKIKAFWKDMLFAVAMIHKHGVIHLDLKPANFMIVDADLKLIDFGIANSIQVDATSVIKDTQFGTLNYMAPETINDMSAGNQTGSSCVPKFKVSPKADVWSLGCILYFIMYGRTPFQHITHQFMKLRAITNEDHRITYPSFPDVEWVKIVQACLTRDPKKRPTVEMLLNHPFLKR